MDRIPSPYGFVPASPHVAFPPWSEAAAWDPPFEDGMCGTLDLNVIANTPIFVRGTGDDGGFFTTPDGRFGLPGTTLRGMVRNVVEIASFSKLSRVNDHRYGVRDLQNRSLYGVHMAAIRDVPGVDKKEPVPLVNAGWLFRERDRDEAAKRRVARIEPCDFAKIHYLDLVQIARKRGVPNFDPGRKQSAVDKYRAWGERDLDVRVTVAVKRHPDAGGAPVLVQFGVVTGPGDLDGTLVFTGQPNRWSPNDARTARGGHPKQHDFVFLSSEVGEPIPVGADLLRDFEFVHSDSGQQHRMVTDAVANAEWKHWRARYREGRPVPVFFLLWPDGSLRAFGLAMMFRLPYLLTTADAVRNAQPLARDVRVDLAETIFGTVRGSSSANEPDIARRGRVSFGLCTVRGNPEPLMPVPVVLGTPKASFYPGYVEQGPRGTSGERPAGDWKTYMDPDARARGWKRYRPQEVREAWVPKKADGQPVDASKTGTSFAPLPEGTVFGGKLRIHNLRPVELGAILWALDFGGAEDCHHLLGLGKPLGYGRVRVEVISATLTPNRMGDAVDLTACREAFVGYMEASLAGGGGWARSPQISELLALARPIPPGSDEGRYPILDPYERRNEFVDAKTQKAVVALLTGGARVISAPPGTQSRVAAPARSVVGPRWKVLPRGTPVRALLTGLSRKGKWAVQLVGQEGKGVVGLGDAPPGLAVGATVDLVVVAGGDPRNLNLAWPS